jgi:hypothetical protein
MKLFRLPPVRFFRLFRPSTAERSAFSIEGWDFEEEQSLDQRHRSPGGRGRTGGMWQYLLF